MPLRPCLTEGCPRLTTGTRCPACQRQRDNRQRRGYDATHDAARRALIAQLPLPCAYGCGRTLTTPADMVAAHVIDGDPHAGWMPACRSCNERAKRRR